MLLSIPFKKDSPTYEMIVNLFKRGAPEVFIKAVIAIDKVYKGQGISMLWLAAFLQEKHFQHANATDKGPESSGNFEKVIKKVASAVFPLIILKK